MNPVAARRRPAHCPRCGERTVGMRYQVVEMPQENDIGWVEDPEELTTDVLDIETEEWVKYKPCGHTVPPEEHEELVNPTTPPDVTR
jgi:hypothetical protein